MTVIETWETARPVKPFLSTVSFKMAGQGTIMPLAIRDMIGPWHPIRSQITK